MFSVASVDLPPKVLTVVRRSVCTQMLAKSLFCLFIFRFMDSKKTHISWRIFFPNTIKKKHTHTHEKEKGRGRKKVKLIVQSGMHAGH